MSILIKGMEMPKENAICVVIFPDGEVTSQFGVPHLGTAVPVPPHGDLIDTGAVDLSDGPYEYQDWVEWAWEQYLNVPVFLPADPPKEET
ncbi:MAG: hypothetical protein IJQ93_12220 [Bacteroidales bacterium]|nr:hypothetical protein [Clostridia bacterium]MBR0301064.1 hypothetical protein [Bacteroidales bacterium]